MDKLEITDDVEIGPSAEITQRADNIEMPENEFEL